MKIWLSINNRLIHVWLSIRDKFEISIFICYTAEQVDKVQGQAQQDKGIHGKAKALDAMAKSRNVNINKQCWLNGDDCTFMDNRFCQTVIILSIMNSSQHP